MQLLNKNKFNAQRQPVAHTVTTQTQMLRISKEAVSKKYNHTIF